MTKRKKEHALEKTRRELNEKEGKCILAPRTSRGRIQHGPPVKPYKKCQHCLDVHSSTDYKGAKLARAADLHEKKSGAITLAAKMAVAPKEIPPVPAPFSIGVGGIKIVASFVF